MDILRSDRSNWIRSKMEPLVREEDTQQKQTNILKRLAFFVALEHFCRCQIARIGCFMASNILIICGSWRQNGEERLLGEQNQVVYDLFYIFLQYRWRTTETQRWAFACYWHRILLCEFCSPTFTLPKQYKSDRRETLCNHWCGTEASHGEDVNQYTACKCTKMYSQQVLSKVRNRPANPIDL